MQPRHLSPVMQSLRDIAEQSRTQVQLSPLPSALTCLSCGAVNRIKPERGRRGLKCGRCKSTLRLPSHTTWALLCDISGSMSWKAGTRTRIEVLRDALHQARDTIGDRHLRVFTFHSSVVQIKVDQQLPEPCGGTGLANALKHRGVSDAGGIVLLSDGCPNSPRDALEAAARLRCPIDVVFCGDPTDQHAVAFMRQLAKQTGGRFSLEPYEQPKASQRIAKSLTRLIGTSTSAKQLR